MRTPADWRANDALMFGRMYEDAAIELAALPEGRVFCIASAGDTAFSLAARGDEVVAVDTNRAQAEYVRDRMRGEPVREGRIDGRLRVARRLVGWRRDELVRFCALDDVEEQARVWRERLDTRRLRLALRPLALRVSYARELVEALPPRFDRVVRARLAYGFATFENASNPYARLLMLGEAVGTPPREIVVEHADAVEFLYECPPQSFDGFALSNVLDGATRAYANRLRAAVRRAARPGAVTVLRSFGVGGDDSWARRDRSLIWGRISVQR